MKGEYLSVENDGFYGVYYPNSVKTSFTFISMLGDSCDDYMAKTGVKWLHSLGCNVLAMSPAAKDYSHHNLPLERFEYAIKYMKDKGAKKIGALGASTTGMLALIVASYFNDISITVAMSPSDFVMEGFYIEDGIERPGDNESTVSFKGEPLPYLPFAYRHPEYWHKLREEAKAGHDMIASRKMFDRSEELYELTDRERIKVENIKGSIVFVGAEDDVLWDTCKYIRRMKDVLEERNNDVKCRYLIYEHGTHFVFPESMLKMAVPIGSAIIPRVAFKAAREYPGECKKTRIDIDKNVKEAIEEWKNS